MLCLTASIGAQAILITPTGATSSTAGTDLFSVSHLIDDSGLVPTPGTETSVHSASNSSNSWVTQQVPFPGDYFDATYGMPVPVLTFDLGGTFNLSSVLIWNYALGNTPQGYNGNQASSINVSFSTTGTGGAFSGAQTLSLLIDTTPFESQSFSIGNVAANAVRFEITDNHWFAGGGGDRVGLSEVKFAVPEPASLVLLGLGLAGVGMSRRRKV
jgi:hypothetical protein